jgi:GH24 family phage-related lysozyme (muramidase)
LASRTRFYPMFLGSPNGSFKLHPLTHLRPMHYSGNKETGKWLPKDDGFGNGTIGWGHNCGKCEDFAGGITKAQGGALLKSDLAAFEKSVNGIVGGKATQQQFDALVAFAFNVRNYQGSTLMHNAGSGAPVSEANFTAYGNARNRQGILVPVPSLLRRRESEWDVYANGIYNSSH